MLRRIVGHVARISPPRHRELVRGMVAELDSIGDPAERTRFALGAIAAIARLVLVGCAWTLVHGTERLVSVGRPVDGADPGGPSMSTPSTRQLLRRHAIPFGISFMSLTVILLSSHAARWVPELGARGVPTRDVVEVVLLAMPFTIALTIPMAVFIAVSWVFTRLGAQGVLASARREDRGVRRLVAPVLGAAAVIAMLTFVSNAEIVPRANARLAVVLGVGPPGPRDRTMTIGELREAAQRARTGSEADAAVRAAAFEVEIQKKFALAAACVVLALAAAAIAMRFPRGGAGLVLGASGVVFMGYDLLLTAGESLADRQLLSPLVAMWTANALLLGVAVLLVWRPGRAEPGNGVDTLAIDG